jgi:hypothetical protein
MAHPFVALLLLTGCFPRLEMTTDDGVTDSRLTDDDGDSDDGRTDTFSDSGEDDPEEIGTSCEDVLNNGTSSGDGVYSIDPDGPSFGVAPFSVYCDMTNGGGGWTLAMRFASSNSILVFNSPYWTDGHILNEANPSPTDSGDAKYLSYEWVEGEEIQGCLYNSGSSDYGCKSYDLGIHTSLLGLFADTPIGSDSNGSGGHFFAETENEMLDWLSIQNLSTSDATMASIYVRTGVNIDDDMSCFDARVRFGLVLNNEDTIYTLNDAAGFGASAYYSASCDFADDEDAPCSLGAGLAAGSSLHQTAGTIWIR